MIEVWVLSLVVLQASSGGFVQSAPIRLQLPTQAACEGVRQWLVRINADPLVTADALHVGDCTRVLKEDRR